MANVTFYPPVGVIVQPRLDESESEILDPRQQELNKDGVCVVVCFANISGFALQKVELLIKKGVCVEQMFKIFIIAIVMEDEDGELREKNCCNIASN